MKEFPECMDYVLDRVGEAALHEQLAEECVELPHAALKKARILRGENPTPVSEEEADGRLTEENAQKRRGNAHSTNIKSGKQG